MFLCNWDSAAVSFWDPFVGFFFDAFGIIVRQSQGKTRLYANRFSDIYLFRFESSAYEIHLLHTARLFN